LQGDEEEMEGLTSSFDDEAATTSPLDNLTVKLQELRRRYLRHFNDRAPYNFKDCAQKPI
jgi:hypothetical protein